jgi:hypothetical protein
MRTKIRQKKKEIKCCGIKLKDKKKLKKLLKKRN